MKRSLKILIIILISLILGVKDIKADELPKLYFKGDITDMVDKSDERKIKVSYVSDNKNFDAYATIKIQGNSSLSYDKKNYTIKLYKDSEYNKKLKVDVGFGEESKYCLKANWIDRTHARNIVTARITSDLQKRYNLFMDTPNNGLIDGFPVEIYINNEFLGLYTFNIPKDEWMFNMDKDNPNHIVFAAENYSDATLFKTNANFYDWDLEVGSKTNETLDKFNRVINFIKNSSDLEFRNNFNEYINLDAMLNYYVMVEFAELIDNTTKNMLMVTYDGVIWYPTLYDMDTSWGTNWNGEVLNDYKILITQNTNENLLLTKFSRNFKNEIANRYFEFRKDILTKENIINEFNTFNKSIPYQSIEKEKVRWNNDLGADISQIEEFLNIRIPLVDKTMYDLYDINASIDINYSTKKLTFKPVEVKLIPNRYDIVIIKDGKKSYDYNYTIKENGEYTFEYVDWYGNNLGTFTISVNWIIPNFIIYATILLIILIFSLLLFIPFKKKINNKDNTKKTKKDTNNKKVKNKKQNDTNKTKKETNNKKNNTTNKKIDNTKKKDKDTKKEDITKVN